MTGFAEHALVSALEQISKLDPCTERNTDHPEDCGFRAGFKPCIGCLARIALKAYEKEISHVNS